MQMNVPDRQPSGRVTTELLPFGDGEQRPHVQRHRVHAHPLIGTGGSRPSFARPVGVELDAVAVGVGQVDGLRHAVIRGPVDRGARGGQA